MYVVEALKRLKLMIASGLSLHHHVEPPRLALTLAACLILTSCLLKGSPNSGVTLIECIYHDSHKVCRCPSTPTVGCPVVGLPDRWFWPDNSVMRGCAYVQRNRIEPRMFVPGRLSNALRRWRRAETQQQFARRQRKKT